MYTCGIDIGSVSTEVVILENNNGESNGKIVSYIISLTGANSKTAADKALEEACNSSGLERKSIGPIVATGYGRINVPFADKNITEISCHARGAISIFPDTRTVLEVMARALEIDLESFTDIFLSTDGHVDISSTCTVFAESEIVSLIGQGVDKNRIIRGLIYSIVSKMTSMIERIGLEEPVCMTGGVAKNLGVVNALEEKLGVRINIPDEPQITGALGAAYLAQNIKKDT